jgi:hypothetical protein
LRRYGFITFFGRLGKCRWRAVVWWYVAGTSTVCTPLISGSLYIVCGYLRRRITGRFFGWLFWPWRFICCAIEEWWWCV